MKEKWERTNRDQAYQPLSFVVSVPFCSHNDLFTDHLVYLIVDTDLLTAAARTAFGQWFQYSYQQKIELFLFGSSDMSNNENAEIFFHVQHFIRE